MQSMEGEWHVLLPFLEGFGTYTENAFWWRGVANMGSRAGERRDEMWNRVCLGTGPAGTGVRRGMRES